VKGRVLHTLPASSWSHEHGAGAAGPADLDARCGLAGLCFREPLGGRGMRSELLLLSCSGVLHRFCVPSAATAAVHGSGPSRAAAPPLHLGAHHPLVSCLAFHQRSGLLAVGGGGGLASSQAALLQAKTPAASGPLQLPELSIWVLSDASPYAALLFSSSASHPRLLAPSALWSQLTARFVGARMPHTLAFSPGGERLAALTLDGQLSVWGSPLVPLGRGGVPEPPLLLPGGRAGSIEQWLGVSWWDTCSVVLHTRGGAVSVCRLPQMTNLLGEQPERFAPRAALSAAHAGQFFVLEHDASAPRAAAAATAATAAAGAAAAAPPLEAAALPPPSGGAAAGAAAGTVAVAGAAAGEAAGGASRVLSLRLLSLRRTSPEQLFARKVATKEFGDALQWAQHYGMSTDPVRQAQWADAGVSAHSIQDYLDKVGDVAWLLHECCSRVPDEAEPLRLLLEYGAARATKELDLRHLRREGEAPLAERGEAGAADEGVLGEGSSTSTSISTLSEGKLLETRARLRRYRERLETSVALCAEESGAQPTYLHPDPNPNPNPSPNSTLNPNLNPSPNPNQARSCATRTRPSSPPPSPSCATARCGPRLSGWRRRRASARCASSSSGMPPSSAERGWRCWRRRLRRPSPQSTSRCSRCCSRRRWAAQRRRRRPRPRRPPRELRG
jgi:hypothetical protein